jgi:hypothetical protein
MGCGASSNVQEQSAKSKATKSKTGDSVSTRSAYAAHEPDSHETEDEDYEEPELTEEQQRLLAELEHRSTVSTAVSAEEPTPFTVNMRVSYICVKARIFHGIDGTCETAAEIQDSDLKRKTSCDMTAAATHARLFGDLKPRQVRKIQEWVQKIYSSNGNSDCYEAVPERYARADGLPNFAGLNSPPASPNLMHTSTSYTEYPDTPKCLRSDDMNSFSGLLTARTTVDKTACDASVSDFSDPNATPRPAIPGLLDEGDETPRMALMRSPRDPQRTP